jgi:hypothetical protein
MEWPDLSMRGDKFDLNWRDVHNPTTTFQGCSAIPTYTPTPAVVRDLVEHHQPNHYGDSCKQSKNKQNKINKNLI